MFIKKISLTNFRSYTQAEFEFKEGMNLLVGINGVGKTTVLEALRVCLSVIYPYITKTKHKKESFKNSDIKIGADYLQVSCDFSYLDEEYNLLIVKRKENYIATNTDKIREQTITIPDQEVFTPSIKITVKKVKDLAQDPIGLMFSTKRSLIEEKAPSKLATQGPQIAAHADALSIDRYFNIKVFADWFNVQEKLGEESPNVLHYVSTIKNAVETFLPGFNNLHLADVDGKLHFFIDKNGIPLSIYQLSDGERGVLSLVLDIAKRLAQANPVLSNPLNSGKGVVLIDELDLHLHPKWQRSVVENLIRTFPHCQFIATTHSPQIVPSIEPERIQLISGTNVINPDRSLGMDSNWILRNLMDAEDRPEVSSEAINNVEKLINAGDFKQARIRIKESKEKGIDLPEWVIFEARIAKLEILRGRG